MKALLVAVIAVSLVPALASTETYICVPTAMTGFSYNKQTRDFEVARFNTAGTQYALSQKDGKWS